MLKKRSRQYCLEHYPQFPQSDNEKEVYSFPKIVHEYILTLPSVTPKGHAKNISVAIDHLAQQMNTGPLIFLGDTNTPWLYQQNIYKPIKAALAYLSEHKVGKRFNGSFEIDGKDLRPFLSHLFWLTRCNAALPYIHFMNKTQDFVASICKYGNLHFYTLTPPSDDRLKKALTKSPFTHHPAPLISNVLYVFSLPLPDGNSFELIDTLTSISVYNGQIARSTQTQPGRRPPGTLPSTSPISTVPNLHPPRYCFHLQLPSFVPAGAYNTDDTPRIPPTPPFHPSSSSRHYPPPPSAKRSEKHPSPNAVASILTFLLAAKACSKAIAPTSS